MFPAAVSLALSLGALVWVFIHLRSRVDAIQAAAQDAAIRVAGLERKTRE